MLYIDGERTKAALPIAELNAAIKMMFIEGCIVPLRHTHDLETGGETAGTR